LSLWKDTFNGNGNGVGTVNLIGFFHNAQLAFLSVNTINVGKTGEDSLIRDTTNIYNIGWNSLLLGTLSTDLDTGSETADTIYYVFIIGDSTGANAPKVLFSLSATAPTLPGTHNVFRRVGAILNDSISDITEFRQAGNDQSRKMAYTGNGGSNHRVLNGGTATSWTAVNCSAFVPSTSRRILVQLRYSNNLTGGTCRIRENGFGGKQGSRPGVIVSNPFRSEHDVGVDENQILEYNLDNALDNLDISIIAYWDDL